MECCDAASILCSGLNLLLLLLSTMLPRSVLGASALLSLLLCSSCLAEWSTSEFMKREHSLIKPYQGEFRGCLGWDPVFSNQEICQVRSIRLPYCKSI